MCKKHILWSITISVKELEQRSITYQRDSIKYVLDTGNLGDKQLSVFILSTPVTPGALLACQRLFVTPGASALGLQLDSNVSAASATVTVQWLQLSKHLVPSGKKQSKLFPFTHLNILCLSTPLAVLPITHYGIQFSEWSPAVHLHSCKLFTHLPASFS